MRKQNSTFKTAFISEAGSELENNDYFAFVELEQYACYVIADGLNELSDARSARLAIETVLLAFQENPSIKKRVVFSYLKAADKALREADSQKRLKASVTVIVTDYANILYGYAGNTRLFLYRDGNMKEQTQDMSLGNDLKKEKRLPDDVLARHEERNNLYTYIGQGNGFAPYVSKKIKLVNGDILTLYTRGIWENLDGGELNDVFSEAKGEPQESLDCIEDLLLSRQPKELGNYTFAAIYVDKVFLDPNQKKRIKKMITVATAILTLVLVGSLILLIFYRQRQSQIANMEQKYFNTIEYIQDNNYLRAKIECEEALKAAEKLKDKKRIREIYDYQKLIEAVNAADSAYSNKKYEEAQSGYATAKERSRYADRIADEYINKQLGMITDYRSVFDYIQLGDTLAAQGDYARAEEKYLQAKSLATRAYFEEGRKEAMEVLEAMYARREEAEEADTQEAKAKASDETGAAQLASQGDKAFSEGDYEGAKAYYAMALEKYQQLGDVVHGELVQTRIASSEQKSTEIKEKEQQAEEYIKAGREQEMTGDKLDAKKQYLLAKNIYKELKMDNKVTEIEGLLELLDVAAMQENIKKENKMSEENNNKKEGLSSGEDSDAIKEEGQEIGPGSEI